MERSAACGEEKPPRADCAPVHWVPASPVVGDGEERPSTPSGQRRRLGPEKTWRAEEAEAWRCPWPVVYITVLEFRCLNTKPVPTAVL